MVTLDLDRASYYNDMGIDTLWTGDIQRSLDISIDIRPPVDVEELDARRRGFERYSLRENMVRAALFGASRHARYGRVTDASVTGMWIETEHPLPFRAEVDVEWSVMGFGQTFQGRVVRSTEGGMAIQLETDDATWRFRSSFIDLARTPTRDPPQVIVRTRRDRADRHVAPDTALLAQLEHEWLGVLEAIEDDEAHQAFINACLKNKRLEFALECYRELKTTNPDSDVATRYLKQIGTILSFYTLQPTQQRDERDKKKLFPIIMIILAVLVAAIAAPSVVRSKLERPSSAAPGTPDTGGFKTASPSGP